MGSANTVVIVAFSGDRPLRFVDSFLALTGAGEEFRLFQMSRAELGRPGQELINDFLSL